MNAHIFGVDRRTVRAAGIPAVFAVIATAMLIEPWLQKRGYGELALAIYVALLPVIAYSLVEDIREWRET